jgi:bifunctional non-homologous end joining protein LigD
MLNISPDALLIGTLERRLHTSTARVHQLESELQEVRDDIAILERMLTPPCEPILRPRPPRGEAWLHEVKFDGFRTQLHKAGDTVTIYSKGGHDFTSRYPAIAGALKPLPIRSAIIDAEVTVCGEDGVPQFYRLLTSRFDQGELCAWAFDLMELNGKDLRQEPLKARKAALVKLLRRASPFLRLSESFSHPIKLLAECERRGLEGVVSKRVDSQYRSGKSSTWIKVKCAAWREANRDRHELFERA